MAVVVGAIAFFAFVAYFGTTFLPTFKPDCPYKTPLTIYSYATFGHLRLASRSALRRVRQVFKGWCLYFSRTPSPAPTETSMVQNSEKVCNTGDITKVMSLREIERESVEAEAEVIDARALAWIFDISSNSSVQSVVLEALGNIPLRTVDIVKRRFPGIHATMEHLLRTPEYRETNEQTGPAFDRLSRALVRFHDTDRIFLPDPIPVHHNSSPAAYSLCDLLDQVNPEDAALFLRKQLDGTAQDKLDVYLWAKILQNALSFGTEWLDGGDDKSVVWQSLVSDVIDNHGCMIQTNCDGSRKVLASLPVHRHTLVESVLGPLNYENFTLELLDSPDSETNFPILFGDAIKNFLHPSFCQLLRQALYPTYCLGDDYKSLPADIRLNLSLIQSPSLLATSQSRDGEWQATIHQVLRAIKQYVAVDPEAHPDHGGSLRRHPIVVKATFVSLSAVVVSDIFLTEVLTFADKRDILHVVIRTLLLDGHLCRDFTAQLSTPLIHEISRIVLRDFPSAQSLIMTSEILESFARSPSTSNRLAVEIYHELSRMGWLRLVDIGALSIIDGVGKSPREIVSYSILAAAYVDGLQPLSTASPSTYSTTVDYLKTVPNLCILGMILLVSDNKRQASLWKITSQVQSRELWIACLGNLRSFVDSATARMLHQRIRHGYTRWRSFRPLELEGAVYHGGYDELPSLIVRLSGPEPPYEMARVTTTHTAFQEKHSSSSFFLWKRHTGKYTSMINNSTGGLQIK
ncbi:hypothetical protein BDZ89DRAFT_545730 [Hymenopellis radicata]|nr:hypothetical protein BDZ89DRAFT_545730 [Hymenopellis radicata]